MSDEKIQVGTHISSIAVSGNYVVGEIVNILQNTIVVSNRIETELVIKKDL